MIMTFQIIFELCFIVLWKKEYPSQTLRFALEMNQMVQGSLSHWVNCKNFKKPQA